MDKAREFLNLSNEESESVSSIKFHPHRQWIERSFYEDFSIRGIKVDRIEPGFISTTFKVPPRLADRNGKLATGAIANLVDEGGALVAQAEGVSILVSVDMSISFLSTANVNDELEITARILGRKGSYAGTIVLVKNKATGELIAEGRHSLFGKHKSKM
ncbi:hypothetical protein OIU76_014795 [Salix suchowensis]|uniref:Acyl-coenzyme A thioesterase 13 n=2 Tax=Salix TaxID=40685 RepID=A0A9Q0YZP5_9ROSI|nr:hypothetical protein OIU76_014795 [Salix suchowensis]KAJ6385094.1 hypothetical protein OIU77_028320 [Salix suchowensis]KAJ6716010.1 hypothetical protein OIU74_008696 [Salix koriyanagi]